jgi:hypothetical protein
MANLRSVFGPIRITSPHNDWITQHISSNIPLIENQPRLTALQTRLLETDPPKLSPQDWQVYRDKSLHVLQPHYPNTNLRELYQWICQNAHLKGKQRLSASEILKHVKEWAPNTEIGSLEELRYLMKALSIRWSNLHSSYYIKISTRFDVVEHLKAFIPLAQMCFEDHRIYLVASDCSYLNENTYSNMAWCSRAEPNGDLIDAKPGTGRRINMMEFLDRDGLVRHPDGKSAGTIFGIGETQDSKEILRGLRRGLEAIRHKADSNGIRLVVLLLDGAKNQKTLPKNAINPSTMNLTDGGKNRVEMKSIGFRGLQSVLTEHNQWPPEGLYLPEARAKLFQWSGFLAQLTEVEALCREFNIILIYNPKAHPWNNPIEKFWRLTKYATQDLLDLSLIRAKYETLVEEFLHGGENVQHRCQKWFAASLKFIHYYARGQTEFVRESKMKQLDLDSLGQVQYPPARPGSSRELETSIHAANNILLLGKKLPQNFKKWD